MTEKLGTRVKTVCVVLFFACVGFLCCTMTDCDCPDAETLEPGSYTVANETCSGDSIASMLGEFELSYAFVEVQEETVQLELDVNGIHWTLYFDVL